MAIYALQKRYLQQIQPHNKTSL